MRRAGVLLHPTSLPGPYGIGDIGPIARDFATWLAAGGQGIWQMLPLHPVDLHGSPYSSPSAFALNPLLLSIDDLVEDGWLKQAEKPFLAFRPRVDLPMVRQAKLPVLRLAAERAAPDLDLDAELAARPWLADWSLYAALAATHGDAWPTWPEALRHRDPAALAAAAEEYAAEIRVQAALQVLLLRQWRRLRLHCAQLDVQLWGDLPFLVGGHSCDVWRHPELFRVDANGEPEVISGVPPDAFSPTGQRWGHPLYRNEAHLAEGFAWWGERARVLTELVDAVRLDHFRGIAALWAIPPEADDATSGAWTPGLGAPLLEALQAKLGKLPIIAEDLGVITPDVEALRDGFELPGMAILQFAFDGRGRGEHAFLPHHHRTRQVVYTGTHDNDTTVGWFESADPNVQAHVRRYIGHDSGDIAWHMAWTAWRSVCENAVVPMQDVLSLDGRARMNTPGAPEGNWGWRMAREAMNTSLARRLLEAARLTGRVPRSTRVMLDATQEAP